MEMTVETLLFNEDNRKLNARFLVNYPSATPYMVSARDTKNLFHFDSESDLKRVLFIDEI
jgi:hypothetical protein